MAINRLKVSAATTRAKELCPGCMSFQAARQVVTWKPQAQRRSFGAQCAVPPMALGGRLPREAHLGHTSPEAVLSALWQHMLNDAEADSEPP